MEFEMLLTDWQFPEKLDFPVPHIIKCSIAQWRRHLALSYMAYILSFYFI